MPINTETQLSSLVNKLKEAIDNNRTLALLLDYDGTLTPIVQNPEDAQLDAQGLERLKRLAENPNIKLALVSGRSVEQLQGFVQSILPAPILLAGLHGGQVFDAESGTWLQKPSDALKKAKELFQEEVMAALFAKSKTGNSEAPEGVKLEEKGFSFAIHYRNAEASVGEGVHQQVETLFNDSQDAQVFFRLQTGHKVIEIVPKSFNKGAGVRFCLDHWKLDKANSLALFAGDDKTDEVGIAAVIKQGGVGVSINVPPSQMSGLSPAQQNELVVLSSPDEFHALLEALL